MTLGFFGFSSNTLSIYVEQYLFLLIYYLFWVYLGKTVIILSNSLILSSSLFSVIIESMSFRIGAFSSLFLLLYSLFYKTQKKTIAVIMFNDK